jgi:hypothetical protein
MPNQETSRISLSPVSAISCGRPIDDRSAPTSEVSVLLTQPVVDFNQSDKGP